MRVLTVRQPWAWAIIHGRKDVENRTRNLAGSYRGPVAIHAGLRVEHDAKDTPVIDDAWHAAYGWRPAHNGLFETGIVLGVVDLVGVHEERAGCCRPWGQRSWDGTRTVHLELTNPRSFGHLGDSPIRAKGRLGLWRPDVELEGAISTQLARIATLQSAGGD